MPRWLQFEQNTRAMIHKLVPIFSGAALLFLSCNTSSFSGNSSSQTGTRSAGVNVRCAKPVSSSAYLSLRESRVPGHCRIVPSGQQPRQGVYAVVLTAPAPCDFRLRSITVSDQPTTNAFAPAAHKLAIGTYWNYPRNEKFPEYNQTAHEFPTVPGPAEMPMIDNGFILIQPDGESYLLFDNGFARRKASNYQSAAQIANQLSLSLGFGPTKLLQPDPGDPATNYATATLFKAGSVIAIYDDTPDMTGSIAVENLITDIDTEVPLPPDEQEKIGETEDVFDRSDDEEHGHETESSEDHKKRGRNEAEEERLRRLQAETQGQTPRVYGSEIENCIP